MNKKLYVCNPGVDLVIRVNFILKMPVAAASLKDYVVAGYTQQVLFEALTDACYNETPVNATLVFTDCVRGDMSGFIIIKPNEEATKEYLTEQVNSMMVRLTSRAKDVGYELRHFQHEL